MWRNSIYDSLIIFVIVVTFLIMNIKNFICIFAMSLGLPVTMEIEWWWYMPVCNDNGS